MTNNSSETILLGPSEGLRLGSGPGGDIIFKLAGEQTGGAFDYFIVEVPPGTGPPAARPPPAGGNLPRPRG